MLEQLQRTFWETLRKPERADGLKEASIEERLGDWTKILTDVVVRTCESMGWKACEKDQL